MFIVPIKLSSHISNEISDDESINIQGVDHSVENLSKYLNWYCAVF